MLSTQLAQEDVEQFRNEARTIARLIHPHIVRILEFGVQGNTPFLVYVFVLPGLVLLPFVLWAYEAVVKRIQAGRQRQAA